MNLLLKMGDLFRPPTKVREEDLSQKGEKKMKILAIQGSPRPKTSNTEILLQEFLKGAQNQGLNRNGLPEGKGDSFLRGMLHLLGKDSGSMCIQG